MKARHIGIAVAFLLAISLATWKITQAIPTKSDPEISNASSWADTFPVFRESQYRIKSYRRITASIDKEVPVLASGSGFLLETSHGLFIVTARHVVEGPQKLRAINVGEDSYESDSTERNSITKNQERIRLGVKSI